jgi:aconitate hydratase
VGQVCVGSSVNSGYEDLAIVAAVLAGQTLPPGLALTVTPGSRQILDVIAASGVYRQLVAAGARMLEPSCGPCVGMGQAPPSGAVSVRTFNRNFPGRSGTMNDRVYLCSPATAAATAVKGAITDPRDLGDQPRIVPMPANPAIDDSQIISPPPREVAAHIEIPYGPNIKPPPQQGPLPETLQGRVLIVVGDDVSTGDLSPDGAEVMAFRSNVPEMARFVFRRIDREFRERAARAGGGFIIAGHNYGQGSSREHAALAPKQLGIRAVIAKSFARIHRRNLLAQGIVPLGFCDERDWSRAQRDQKWTIPDLRTALESGDEQCDAIINGVSTIRLSVRFSERERRVLLAGGLLAHLRDGGHALSLHFGHSGSVDQGSPVTSPSSDDLPR